MTGYGYSLATAPPGIRRQIDGFVRATVALLADNLRGIYLHGSLAQGSFQPDRSDIDLLVLSHRPLAQESKHRFAEILLTLSGAPRPLEMSLLHTSQFTPWRYPAPYDFHFSEDWRAPGPNGFSFRTRGGWARGAVLPHPAASSTVSNVRGGVHTC